MSAPHAPHASPLHAPNAALLIDFDNVTMGIRSDLATELRNLLSSDIIRGKVAVQRAYADWRRYPNYVVTLAESSIDMIMAPAYGSSKKNATDIRLAIDALELVFTRPEIGTFILLSGDSDFSSLVIKLKEYGKYVIGVGIRESSSDLLVMNCDEYYSWNALTGLVKKAEDEPQEKWDPWELVTEAVQRMKRNGDVMRSDRLKQVMQELDPSFDEKNLGMAKFSRFVQEASHRGLVAVNKLENGQLEIDVPAVAGAGDGRRTVEPEPDAVVADRAGQGTGGRRTRRGRGRDRGRGRGDRDSRQVQTDVAAVAEGVASNGALSDDIDAGADVTGQVELTPEPSIVIGVTGERLTRDEAFDLVRRAVESLTADAPAAHAADVRRQAREVLGRDSESLSERNFARILRDAHDADVVDLRRRGDDFEVARAARHAPAPDQQRVSATPPPTSPALASPPALPGPRTGLGPRGAGPRGRGGRLGPPPPELLSIGVVPAAGTTAAGSAPAVGELAPVATDHPAARPASQQVTEAAPVLPAEPLTASEALTGDEPLPEPSKRSARGTARRGRGRKQATKRAAARVSGAEAAEVAADISPAPPISEPTSASKRSRAKTVTKPRRGRKSGARSEEA
jgi:uncharacterized LabA/DUF88 family protein